MSLISSGTQPVMPQASSSPDSGRRKNPAAGVSASSSGRHLLFFIPFLILFYCVELFWIGPVDGINDDWGMYSTLSGAYLGYPDAHVLFFLYPLSWALAELYRLCSFIPWYGLFLHGVTVAALYTVYGRGMRILERHNCPDAPWKPALTILCILFPIIGLNVISEVQYTTVAGIAAAAAIFCFTTTRTDLPVRDFILRSVPAFVFAWLSYSMRQNIFYLMLPIAGMIWLSKWNNARRCGFAHTARKLLGFAAILLAGMGILYGLNEAAYSSEEWRDFRRINYYRERVGDFYTWPEYGECADALNSLGITEEEYLYRRNGAPFIGYGMSVEDWEQMHAIAKSCFLARTSVRDRLKNIVVGSVGAFFYEDGMQPANLLALALMAATFILILLRRNLSALSAFFFYFLGRAVSWIYVLYEGRFPKRIIQPLIFVDYAALFGILLGFNMLRAERSRKYRFVLPVVFLLCAASIAVTKNNVDADYHAHEETWEALKAYCHAHPDNLYIWTYDSGTLENYCESPFDMTLDTYNNFVYTNWGVILNPNTRVKLTRHGVGDFARDVVESDHTCFILREAPYNEEHPVIMYFRHTYGAAMETVDAFTAGDTTYMVYRLRPEQP